VVVVVSGMIVVNCCYYCRRRTVLSMLPRGDRHLAFGSRQSRGLEHQIMFLPNGAQFYCQMIQRPFRGVCSPDLSCSERAVEVEYESWGVPIGRGSRAFFSLDRIDLVLCNDCERKRGTVRNQDAPGLSIVDGDCWAGVGLQLG
jgi:hypothetical protein